MARGTTLYRFKVSLSDVDRAAYEDVDFRVAMHPSESEAFLLTRVLAYLLNYADGLEFTQGLATPDEPSLKQMGDNGQIAVWIDIGNPTARRIHKAAKAAQVVRIYTYKDPENLRRETAGEEIHRAEQVEVIALPDSLLGPLARDLARDNRWTFIRTGDELVVTSGDATWISELSHHRLRS